MSVITVSRQMGSLGREIARLAADRLEYRLVWRDLINQAARRAGAPEMALAAIDELGLLGICPSPKACWAYRQAVEQVMFEQANEGNVVIVGRAGQMILHQVPGVLHVRVIAPFDVRVARVAQRQSIDLVYAQAQVEASDKYRKQYLRRFYRARWDDPALYHLVINSAFIEPEQAAAIICQAAETLLPVGAISETR